MNSMSSNGIGPLVSQFVHERNALRKASLVSEEGTTDATKTTVKAHPHGDTVEFSDSALARFEALKARLAGKESEEETESNKEEQPTTETVPVVAEPEVQPEQFDFGTLKFELSVSGFKLFGN